MGANTTGMVDAHRSPMFQNRATGFRMLARSGLAAMLALLVMVSGVGCSTGPSDADIKTIKIAPFRALVEESKTKPGQILIIDARSADEYRASHVEGARNLRADQLRPESPVFSQLTGYETIVVYGADPASGSAKQATKRLMEYAEGNILWFQGGMKFWKAAGYPVVENAPSGPRPVDISPSTSLPPLQQPQPAAIPSGLPTPR